MSKKRLYLLLGTLCIFGYAWLLYSFSQISNHHFSGNSICVFKQISGLPCPSCGTTRSIIYLLEGNFSEGLKVNPLGFISLLFLVVFPFWIMYDFSFRRSSFYQFYQQIENFLKQPKWAVPAIFLVVLNWGWNILKGL